MNYAASPPLISIVLCTFNGAQFLAVQLDSLFAQTHPNLEIIVVDDASTDGTMDILKQYAALNGNMRVYQNKERLGYIKNFELACRLASGSFIALCDQDDYWLPQKLEKLAAAIGTADLVHCDSALCNVALEPTGVRVSDRAVYKPLRSPLEQAVVCRLYGHGSLFTRTLLERSLPFPTILPHDWWLAFNATLGGGVQYLPEVLVHYRQHSHNAVGAVGEKRKGKKRLRSDQVAAIRHRMRLFYQACPEEKRFEKRVLARLHYSYQGFDLIRNFRRMLLFFKHGHFLLGVKKRSPVRKWLFCLKMFWNIK